MLDCALSRHSSKAMCDSCINVCNAYIKHRCTTLLEESNILALALYILERLLNITRRYNKSLYTLS